MSGGEYQLVGWENMNVKNSMHLEFQSLPENVAFSRSCVGAFASQLECSLDDIEEVKLVVSEAVSNSIIHGYGNIGEKMVDVFVYLLDNNGLEIIVKDQGKGIENLEKALEPTYSSDPARMGMGFTFMKSFTDEMEIKTKPQEGTSVRLRRYFNLRDKPDA